MPVPVVDCLYSPESGTVPACAVVSACAESAHSLLLRMDDAGISRVVLSPCKRWKCERHWVCGEIQVDEVLQYVDAAPDRFAALAGYNPYAITESLQQVERAVKLQGVRGVYVHTEGSDVGLQDRRMYPLYARAVELGIPVMVQVAASGKPAGPGELLKVAVDFSELTLVAAWTGVLDLNEARNLCADRSNVLVAFDVRRAGQGACEWLKEVGVADRCIWGSDGLPWKDLLLTLNSLALEETLLRKYLHDNAEKLFQLDRKSASPLRPVGDIMVAER